MKLINWAFFILLFFTVFASCKKDDDDDSTVTDDPRVRTITVSGIKNTFVVNDYESIIYNYDSLSFGTSIHARTLAFYGYGSSLDIQYMKDGVWNNLSSTESLDLTSGLQIKATAPDGVHAKEYKLDIRVHRYDVEAITWEKKGELPIDASTVVAQKTIVYNGQYYFFYTNTNAESYVLISADGENWQTQQPVEVNSPDWNTLTLKNQRFLVRTVQGFFTCDPVSGFRFEADETPLPLGTTDPFPLFTLNDKFWMLANEGGTHALYSLAADDTAYTRVAALPSDFPTENINTFVSNTSANSLGYIFGGKNADETGSVWSIDVNGNILDLTYNQTSFPAQTNAMPLYFSNALFLVGGKTSDGFTDDFYESPNYGASWFNNTHKTLPSKIGARANGFIYEYERNNLILIGGETANGFDSSIWKGILNQEILDGLINP